jgi:hypothetical protein
MTDISQRPTTVSFGTDVILGRRKSRAYSIVPDSRESEAFRRQSFKYQFPNPALEAEKRDIDLVIYKLKTNSKTTLLSSRFTYSKIKKKIHSDKYKFVSSVE